MSLGEHAARPDRHEGAEHGILDDADEELGTPAHHRLHEDGGTDGLDGLANGVVVGKIECDAPGVRLVSAGLRGLHDDRVAEVSGRLDSRRGVVRDPLVDEGNSHA